MSIVSPSVTVDRLVGDTFKFLLPLNISVYFMKRHFFNQSVFSQSIFSENVLSKSVIFEKCVFKK